MNVRKYHNCYLIDFLYSCKIDDHIAKSIVISNINNTTNLNLNRKKIFPLH